MHREAVGPELLGLLVELMNWPDLAAFSLVGGTSLALRSGYRDSEDIDLFTMHPFDPSVLKERLKCVFPDCEVTSVSRGTIIAFSHGVKIDFMQHLYKTLAPDDSIENIRMASLRDLSAMKVNALSQRGSKKDFSDLLFLQESGLPLMEALENYLGKYSPDSLLPALQSLTYFGDTVDEPDPKYRNGWVWDQVKRRMEILGKDVQREYNERGKREARSGLSPESDGR